MAAMAMLPREKKMVLVRLPTLLLLRILLMGIANSCAAGREIPRTKNQSTYIHGNSPGDRVYGQTARSAYFRHQKLPILKHCT